jgi:adenosylcobinamide hydrolase
MIHYIKDSTLIIKGEFQALSSGINGGRGHVDHLFNHQVQPDFDHFEPAQYMDRLVDSLQMQRPCFGLLTAVNMNNLCVMTDDYLTTFVTAGITHPSPHRANIGTINIILVIKGILSESAMVGAVVTATEAKGLALLSMGFDFLGTTTDAVIIAYEKQPRPCIEYAGPYTDLGKKITKTVITGIQEGIKKTGSDTS